MKNVRRYLREYGPSILAAVVLALVIRVSVVMAYVIPSGSMQTTLEIGDQVLVNKLAYDLQLPFLTRPILHLHDLDHGDVIVFDPPREVSAIPYVKRVIGLPGDVIQIVDKKVFLNGRPLIEPYARHVDPTVYPAKRSPRDNFGPLTVPPGKLFVLGDNRDNSADSRFWGLADLQAVKGKALLIHFSWDWQKLAVRWDRLLKPVN